jgi:hypothetical protein
VTHLSDEFEIIHFLFHENAAALYPDSVKLYRERREYFILRSPTQPGNRQSEWGSLPNQLEWLADAISTFHDALLDTTHFPSQVSDGSIVAFEQDLRVSEHAYRYFRPVNRASVLVILLSQIRGYVQLTQLSSRTNAPMI